MAEIRFEIDEAKLLIRGKREKRKSARDSTKK